MSTIPIVLTSESRVDSIQKFIESSPATWAPVHCSRTSRCRSGWILARKRSSALREPSESFGWKSPNTFSWVSSVFAELRSYSYSPAQKKVWPPSTCSMSSVLTPRSRSTAYSASPKSSPTGPTTRTSVKKLAASEKWVAAPPRMRSRSPKGVLIASNAIDPTTVTDMRRERLVDGLGNRLRRCARCRSRSSAAPTCCSWWTCRSRRPGRARC